MRAFVHLDASLPVYGLSSPGFLLLVSDFVNPGSALPLQSLARCGPSTSAYGLARLDFLGSKRRTP